jgi:glycosyltransferase involved in cell wall biosynthesis
MTANAGSARETRLRTVCLVLHSLEAHGAQTVAARLVRKLRGHYRFVAACLDGAGSLSDELRADGVPVRLLGRRPGIDLRTMWRLARLLREEHVDLVHAHQYTPFFYSVAARLSYRRPPILFTEHGRLVPERPRRKRIVYNRALLERRDRVVAVGRAVRQALVDFEGIPEERVAVIYNGVDTPSAVEDVANRDQIRAEIGIGKDDLLILQVARLDPVKDHATALRALERVARRRRDTRLVLVGEGPDARSPARAPPASARPQDGRPTPPASGRSPPADEPQ